jgi:hypothetical protein
LPKQPEVEETIVYEPSLGQEEEVYEYPGTFTAPLASNLIFTTGSPRLPLHNWA